MGLYGIEDCYWYRGRSTARNLSLFFCWVFYKISCWQSNMRKYTTKKMTILDSMTLITPRLKVWNFWDYFDFDIVFIYLGSSRFTLAHDTRYVFLALYYKKIVQFRKSMLNKNLWNLSNWYINLRGVSILLGI